MLSRTPGQRARNTSTPTCRTVVSLLVAGALLQSCTSVIDVGRAAPSSLLVSNDVVVSGPPGYCIDKQASRVAESGEAFVLLGSCASITGEAGAERPDHPGLLTVTVSTHLVGLNDADLAPALSGFFQGEAGRAALSRSGEAGAIQLLETRVVRDKLVLHFTDASVRSKGIASEHWRSIFSVNGRLVTAAVSGFGDRPLSDAEGYDTLEDLSARIRRASEDLKDPSSEGV